MATSWRRLHSRLACVLSGATTLPSREGTDVAVPARPNLRQVPEDDIPGRLAQDVQRLDRSLSAPPDSFVDYALDRVRGALRSGEMRPGDRVTADDLARRLGISHIPVREALRYLEAEGQLVRDRRRLIVAPVSVAEAEDIYRTRAILEREAIQLGVPRLTADDLRVLADLATEMETAAGVGDQARYQTLTRRFHFIPFERSGRPWIVRFLHILWDAAVRYQRTLYQEGGWRSGHQHHHKELLAALSVRDVDQVERILQQHRRWLLSQVRRGDGSRRSGSEEPKE